MTKGWTKEPARHSLSARGIRTVLSKPTGYTLKLQVSPENRKKIESLIDRAEKKSQKIDAMLSSRGIHDESSYDAFFAETESGLITLWDLVEGLDDIVYDMIRFGATISEIRRFKDKYDYIEPYPHC